MEQIEKNRTANNVYKALGFKWLNQAFYPASAFVSADRNEARIPPLVILQPFIRSSSINFLSRNISNNFKCTYEKQGRNN